MSDGRKRTPIRSKQPMDLNARTIAAYQALEKRYVAELGHFPVSLLPTANSDLRQVRQVIRLVRQRRAWHQAIADQLRSSS